MKLLSKMFYLAIAAWLFCMAMPILFLFSISDWLKFRKVKRETALRIGEKYGADAGLEYVRRFPSSYWGFVKYSIWQRKTKRQQPD